MVLNNSPAALIVTTAPHVSAPLDDLAAHCEWPLVVKANPRRLATELSLHSPECLLFWLEEEQRTTETASLIAWMRERGQRPFRLAVAYRMVADVEPLLRAAGAHAFLQVADSAGSRVSNVVQSLIGDGVPIEAAANSSAATVAATNDPATRTMEALTHLMQPP